MTIYRDQNGARAGSAMRYGNMTIYHDADGYRAGSRTDFGGDE
jgi:hypothetical protein